MLIALVPVLLAILKGRDTTSPEKRQADPPPAHPPAAFPAAVERGADLAEKYFASLEARALRAEGLLEQTRSDLIESDRRHAADTLEWQRQLDAAHAEIAQLRQQIERLMWRSPGGGA